MNNQKFGMYEIKSVEFDNVNINDGEKSSRAGIDATRYGTSGLSIYYVVENGSSFIVLKSGTPQRYLDYFMTTAAFNNQVFVKFASADEVISFKNAIDWDKTVDVYKKERNDKKATNKELDKLYK